MGCRRTLQWDLYKAGMLYIVHLSVAYTFSWNYETDGLEYTLKILLKIKLSLLFYDRGTLSTLKVLS